MFDTSDIDFSWADKRKKITLPKFLTEELAEDIGIHIGDGSMYLTCPTKKSYILRYSGNIFDDKEYHLKRVIPLKKSLFNAVAKGKILNPNSRRNEFGFVICSKAIYSFYFKILGIPSGNKCKIARIPKIILNSTKKIQCAFLRGLADTDFSLSFKNKTTRHIFNNYPVISANFASKRLVHELRIVLSKLGFKVVYLERNNPRYEKFYMTYIINLNGKNNLENWMNKIGFKNSKHLTKYLIWKKFGFCPPYTTIYERKQIIRGDLDPYSFYED